MDRGSGTPGASRAVLVVGSALLLLAVVLLARTVAAAPSTDAPRALVLTGGSVALAPPTVAGRALERLGLEPTVAVAPASGFVGDLARPGTTLLQSLQDQDLRDLDLVVAQGGEGDHYLDPRALERALPAALQQARDALADDVVLVVVGPLPSRPGPAPSFARVDEVLRRVAEAQDLPYVSPMQRGWTTSTPTLAEDLAEALRPSVPR